MITNPPLASKMLHPPDEVLPSSLLAVLVGTETFVDIARFGDKTLDLLRRFRPFRDGIPAHDTWAMSSQPWTPYASSAASSPGWPRYPACRLG
jgi:hypothetical protein